MKKSWRDIMEINRLNVNDIVNKSGLKPDKDYGQNYLIEPSICEKIVDLLDIKHDDHVLEIGPGIGSLTHFIDQKDYEHFTLVDIDQRMINFLKIIYTKNRNEIVLADIRKHDVSNYTKIIGNLPYNITTETIVYLLQFCMRAKKLVLMCQTETFAHFFDTSGKEYGPASILIHLLGTIKREFNVKPGSFYPAPKCSSTVFTIDISDDARFWFSFKVYLFAKQLFQNRRKTIYNNLSNYLKDKDFALHFLEKVNIAPNKRPEEISPHEYGELLLHVQSIC